ncbi:MAG: hypothetical protein ACXACA_04065 [Candidatus Ranarchaeia archaeon]|jgi:hypothetical protein
MFRELKDRLEERKEKLQSTGDPESFEQYFRVENTIFKLPKTITLLGIKKTRQLIKTVKDKAPSMSFYEALKQSKNVIGNREDIPVNYQKDITEAMDAMLDLSPNTIDAIMESEEEVREATVKDLIDI